MYLKRLSDKIWLTRNARFNAAKRMKRNHISSTASVALLSASVIAVNLLAFVDGISNDEKTLITIVSVILSTFVLVMSLLIALLRYEWRENNYHQCGLELENLNQRIDIYCEGLDSNGETKDRVKGTNEDNKKFQKDYADILKKYNLNHLMFDYEYGRLSDPSSKKNLLYENWLLIRMYVFDVYLLYWIIALLPIISIVIKFCMLLIK